MTDDMSATIKLPDLLSRFLGMSKSEARRLLRDRAIKIDGEVVTSMIVVVKPGSVVRVGKHHFLRIGEDDE